MKKYIVLLIFLSFTSLSLQAQTFSDDNFIYTASPKKPVQSANYNTLTKDDITQSVTYFDGLGRPVQTTAIGQGGNGEDLITPIQYDGFGRQIKEFLAYPVANGSGSYPKIDPLAAINAVTAFYNSPNYQNTSNPFSEKKLEASPLNRVLQQAAPGTAWGIGSGHEIKFDYQTNTGSEVKLYKVSTSWDAGLGLYTIGLIDGGNYAINQLYKTVTYDENSAANPTPGSELLGSTVEFKNKEGQVVLKRTYDGGLKHDTYYVYDTYGNLTYVIPPKADSTVNDEVLNGLCYQYKYDNRNRLVEKKLPGKQWEFIVYDKLDRPAATGPAFSPFKDDPAVGWIITKYDVLGRPIYTGWMNQAPSSAARKTLQYAQDSAPVYETKDVTKSIDGIPAYYTNANVPTNFKLLTVNYYDNYAFPNVKTPPTTILTQTVLVNTKGLATGTWTRAATTASAMLGETTTTFYDSRARPISSYKKNHLGGYLQIDNQLDFSGKTITTKTEHLRSSGGTVIQTEENFSYSAQDRLLTHVHKINGVDQLMADNKYNALGQLESKKVGNNTGAPLQKVDFTYNIRGWLTGINNVNDLQNDLFAFKINYDTPQPVTGVFGLYNGNISETLWTTGSSPLIRGYGYKYDKLNRLKDAVYEKSSVVTNMYDENLTYDKNGNIIFLKRKGDSDTQIGGIGLDDLVYNYPINSNQLSSVVDNYSNTSGFNDFNKIGDDYSYDANGNLITDKNKNITAIAYNHLNLPKKITFGSTGSIEYIYNALGQKLEKNVTQNSVTVNANYLDGFQYKDNVLEFFPTAEGYVKNTSGTLSYVFQYKDHLGNNRISYIKNASNVLEIIDENNYYPFGLKHKGYNDYVPTNNKYKYNGKELQDEMGLGVYDYGFRNFDPALGRWMNIDPLAEKMRRYSPFTYALDNPIFFVDPDGMKAEAGQSGNYYDWDEGIYKNKDSGKQVDADVAIASHTEGGNGDDPPAKKKPGMVKQFLLAVPVLGATIESSDKIGEGDYFGAALSFGAGVMDLFTLGTANKYKTGTAGVIAGIEVAAEQTGKYGGLSVAEKYGIKSYSSLRTLIKGKSLQAHHLIEQRFASTLGLTPGSMSSIAVTAEEHQIFTNAWRTEIGYKGSEAITTTANATKEQIYNAARKVYKDYPQILKDLGL